MAAMTFFFSARDDDSEIIRVPRDDVLPSRSA